MCKWYYKTHELLLHEIKIYFITLFPHILKYSGKSLYQVKTKPIHNTSCLWCPLLLLSICLVHIVLLTTYFCHSDLMYQYDTVIKLCTSIYLGNNCFVRLLMRLPVQTSLTVSKKAGIHGMFHFAA